MALVAERGLPYFDLDEGDLADELAQLPQFG